MKGRSLLAFMALAVALSCDSDTHPTGISEVHIAPSSVLSDGANGGNPDFFFLPPLVKKPKHDPNFELGKFNNSLQPSLTVEICALESTTGLPAPTTECDGAPVKTFGAGTVQLVNLPGPKPGLPRGFNPESWWKGHDRADGFYYVLWNTRQPGLNPDKYYRIKVLVEGSDTPLGYADVDVKTKGRKWQHSRTSDVIELIDGVMLPIPFRVEKGAFCEDPTVCNSGTITNNTDPNAPDQVVVVEGPDGPIGGAAFPSNFLPEDGPQSIVVTISRVRTQGNGGPLGTLCHPTLRSQQFEGCFKFETIPELDPIGGSNDQFTRDVRVAVCFELDGSEDPRNEFVQLWASDAGRPPRRLPNASDAGILTSAAARDCGDPSQIGSSEANGVLGLASAAWRKVQGGFSRVFGVKTAYAVDKGLGGLVKGFSNIGPALTTLITRNEQTDLPVTPGDTITATVRIVGLSHHDEEEGPPTGIGGQPVTFSVAAENGVLGLVGSNGVGATTISLLSGSGSVEDEEPAGFAQVRWALPEQPGIYKLLATGAGPSDTVSFIATVEAPALLPDLVTSSGTPILTPTQITTAGGVVTFSPITISNPGGSFTLAGGVRFGVYLSADATITSADQLVGSANIPPGSLEMGGTFNLPLPFGNIPSGVAPGNYFLGFLIDDNNAVAESNEGNNFVSAPLTVVFAQRMVSMQTGATIQFSANPPAEIATWASSAPTKVAVSAIGQVVATVGGGNSNGGDGATLTSVLTTGAAGPTWLVNTPFTIFPRVTTAVWGPVQGAASYDIVVEHGNGCSGYANCELWTASGGANGIAGSSSTFTFAFVGAQPGRWRVTARDVTGAIMQGSPMPYIYFAYTI